MTKHEPSDPVALARHYLGDLVYGASDGIITTFAIVCGVAGAALEHRIVLILGVANLLGDGFSMGASNFLAIRSNEAALRADGRSSIEPFPLRHATATFSAFVIAGSIPLLSYAVELGESAFSVAATLALIALFGVGVARAVVTDGAWLRGGVEILAVGSAAAAVAYTVGALIAPLTS